MCACCEIKNNANSNILEGEALLISVLRKAKLGKELQNELVTEFVGANGPLSTEAESEVNKIIKGAE